MTADATTAKPQGARQRYLLEGGSAGLLIGIVLSFIGQGDVGGWFVAASGVALMIGLHTFGRLGPDLPELPPVEAADPPKRSRKKRKASNAAPQE